QLPTFRLLSLFISLSALLPPDRPSFPTRRSSDLLLRQDPLQLLDALLLGLGQAVLRSSGGAVPAGAAAAHAHAAHACFQLGQVQDRKSTRLNSSHVSSSYAAFCVKKKDTQERYSK